MPLLNELLGVPINVYGPETHTTEIAPLAPGVRTSDRIHVPQTPPPPHIPTTPGSRTAASGLSPLVPFTSVGAATSFRRDRPL